MATSNRIKWMTVMVSLLMIFSFFYGNSQDLHYSQFYNAHVNINPALTGIFNGDVRVAGNYRSQWKAVPVPYMTFTGAGDFKIYKRPDRSDFFGLGLVFNYDQAGDSKLSLGTLGIDGSYTTPLSKNNFLTFGGQVAFTRRAFSLDDLTFDNQWNGVQFVPTTAINEIFDQTSKFIPDLSAGINYRWQKSARTKLDFGFAGFHLNSPNDPFYTKDKSVKLPVRMALNALFTKQISNSVDIIAHGIAQFQGSYKEILLGGGPKVYLNQARGKNYAIGLYGMYRFRDAIAPALHIYLNELQFGISYDINTSPWNVVTSHKGGPEISVTYIITKVKPLSQFKACPIF